MTDETKPWRASEEWLTIGELVWEPGITKDVDDAKLEAALDALCARVWREARHGLIEMYRVTTTGQETARAEAAEARVSRLAAALECADRLAEKVRALNVAVGKLPGDMLEDWHLFTEWEMSCLRHGEYAEARAALAEGDA